MRKIAWESKHYVFDPETAQLTQEPEELEPPQSYEDMEGIPVQKVLETPFGLFSVDDVMNPFRQFKFWMGHTNFSLGDNAAYILEHTPGVEVLKILTRYRFMIGIGKLYEIRDVRLNIEKSLCGTTNDLNIEKN